jgi:transcription factor 1
VKKPIKAMTVHDWALLLKAFDEWPFAPEVSPPSVFTFAGKWGIDQYSVDVGSLGYRWIH